MSTEAEVPSAGASTELERHEPAQVAAARQGLMGDAEIDRTYRQARALAASGIYKDVRTAEQAFAKLLVGRALGLNEAQSLQLHVVEGKVELPYNLMGMLVRARDGYDYRPAWIKEDAQKNRAAVYCDEDSAADLREVVGASLEFFVDGKLRGVSTWTVDDSRRASLLRDKGNHQKYPRNMFLARAMANGVKWYVPEVASGLPVYSEGEVERVPNLAEGEQPAPAQDGPGWGDSDPALVAEVEKVVRRAEGLGHAGIASKATAQMALVGQPPKVWASWTRRASAQLDRLKAAQGPPPAEAPPEPAVEVVDAVVVPEAAQEAQQQPQEAQERRGLQERLAELDELIRDAERAGDDEALAEFSAEHDQLRAELAAASDENQEKLL